jgi:hypothetical protein
VISHLKQKVKIKFIVLVNAGLKQLKKKLYSDIESPSLKKELERIVFVLAVVIPNLAFIMTILFVILALLIIGG